MNVFLYIMTILVWGSTWLTITYQIGTVPLSVSVFYRFALATLLVFAWCLFKRESLKFSLKTHGLLVAQGFFLFSMNYLMAYEASQYIPSGLNALGFSMILVFNILNSALFYRAPLTLSLMGGALTGIVGMACIFWPAIVTLDLTNASLLGIGFSLFAGLIASFGNMLSAQLQKENISVMQSNAYAMGYGTLWILGVVLLKGEPFTFDFAPTYLISLVYLAVFGSIVAFWTYLTLLGRIGASKAAYSLVVVPLVSLLVSTFFEDFVWETHVFLGVGLILLGNVIILSKKGQPKLKPIVSEKVPLAEAV